MIVKGFLFINGGGGGDTDRQLPYGMPASLNPTLSFVEIIKAQFRKAKVKKCGSRALISSRSLGVSYRC